MLGQRRKKLVHRPSNPCRLEKPGVRWLNLPRLCQSVQVLGRTVLGRTVLGKIVLRKIILARTILGKTVLRKVVLRKVVLGKERGAGRFCRRSPW
jgi:hypothetical protein